MRHSLNPTVTGVDNRGNTEHPFGYVYFSDGNRLMFGDTVTGVGPYGLNTSNWGALPRKPYFEIAETSISEALAPKTETTDEIEPDDDDDCPNGCGNAQEDCACECGECGCSTNEFVPGCDCESGDCPAGCGD
jgi:hypothetical protein